MYTQQLSSLKTITTDKDFALCSFLFAPVSAFTAVPGFLSVMKTPDEADAVELADFVFKSGGAWFTFDDLTDTADFLEEKKDSDAGPYFEVKLEYLLNGDDFEERGRKMRVMFREEHIIIARQANGAWRLIGSLLRGADFEYTYAKQLHKCAFLWQSENPCLYINI